MVQSRVLAEGGPTIECCCQKMPVTKRTRRHTLQDLTSFKPFKSNAPGRSRTGAILSMKKCQRFSDSLCHVYDVLAFETIDKSAVGGRGAPRCRFSAR